MISREEQSRATTTAQASDWFVANDAGPLDARESAALLGWLRASPRHIEEFIGLTQLARALPGAGAHPDFSVGTLLARAHAEEQSSARRLWSRVREAVREEPGYRWQTAVLAMAAFGAVTVGLLSGRSLWPDEPAPAAAAAAPIVVHLATRHGEQQTHRLADNSVLHLNTDTAVTVRYNQSQRLVEIASGEADFEVSHEPGRPFRVVAGGAEVIDLGTKFDVRLRNDLTVVTVIEGRVAVRPALMSARAMTDPSRGRPLEFLELGANQEITVSETDWPTSPVTVDAQQATAWLHRQIIFQREPLDRVASEFNRYTPQPIEIITPKLRHLEITGDFSTDDSEEFLAFLRSLEGVKVDETAARISVAQK